MKNIIVERIQKSLIDWYDFKPNSRVLYIDEKNNYIKDKTKETFDYIVRRVPIEAEEDVVDILQEYRYLLKDTGTLLFTMNNRFGIRYFCGDKNPYTKQVMDKSRLYCKSQMEELLLSVGFVKFKFYSVFSSLDNPSHIFSYGYKPNEDIANRLFPSYNSPETVFLEEEQMYRDMIDNDIFHAMANGYVVEASKDQDAVLSDALQITSSMEREPENAFFTIVHGDGTVSKENVYPEGKKRFQYMQIYAKDLKEHGFDLVEMEITERGISMPFVDASTGQLALKEILLSGNRKAFLGMLDSFRDYILQSSDIEYEDVNLGPIARYGYIDLVPLNSFYIDGKFVFFDQEFRVEHYPINAIIARMLATFYFGNEELKKIIPMDDLYERYGILENKDLWFKMEWDFLSPLRNEEALAEIHAKTRRNNELTIRNRKRMNFSADRYNSVFSEIFSGFETKDVYVFGSGRFAERFMDWYGQLLSVKRILDNDFAKWGKYLRKVEIVSPDILTEIARDSYKIIICIKNYRPIAEQLDEMGVSDYSVYDGRTVYPRKFGSSNVEITKKEEKLYHIGYISGTFDLFHKGHLNLLKRAKEQCDYLIVGVVTDEGVRKFKHVEPYIPFEERREIVEACKYVDEANAIPLEHRDIRSAYSLYHFDCQFCGSDYNDDPVFIRDREWLRSMGSNLEILPYTESTSSTKIKTMIENELLSL